ncbi:MAG TPA: Uma2 family endonuclease [Chthonomonadaceae bacterium]|nr:Uma2 family endonuclease [Chthonomonadaceae bacterium]
MTDLIIRPCNDIDARTRYVADGPIDFETWLTRSLEADRTAPETELVRGVIIDKMAAQYPHEWIAAWLARILGIYVEELQLGVVLGSRSAVQITTHDGRLPDLLFVRAANTRIIRNDAIYGTPDLVIEIISECDRPYNLVPLEADYRSIGVREIVFIDPKRRRVRLLRHRSAGLLPEGQSAPNGAGGEQPMIPSAEQYAAAAYDEFSLTEGRLEFTTVPGFHFDIAWLFAEDRPNALSVIKMLLDKAALSSDAP